MAWVDAWLSFAILRPRAKPLGFCHSLRLQINSVNLVALGCHNQRSISNIQRLDKNTLNILLERWVNPIREDCQIPDLLVGLITVRRSWK